jgi:hypothetical protein
LAYRECHFGAHEFVAFLAHEIPGAQLYMGANLGFEPSSPSEMGTILGVLMATARRALPVLGTRFKISA